MIKHDVVHVLISAIWCGIFVLYSRFADSMGFSLQISGLDWILSPKNKDPIVFCLATLKNNTWNPAGTIF